MSAYGKHEFAEVNGSSGNMRAVGALREENPCLQWPHSGMERWRNVSPYFIAFQTAQRVGSARISSGYCECVPLCCVTRPSRSC